MAADVPISLISAIKPSDTTLDLVGAHRVLPSVDFRIALQNPDVAAPDRRFELVDVHQRDGSRCIVTRGVGGTNAHAHPAGETVLLVPPGSTVPTPGPRTSDASHAKHVAARILRDAGWALEELDEGDYANVRALIADALQLASDVLDDDLAGLMEANA